MVREANIVLQIVETYTDRSEIELVCALAETPDNR